MNEQEYKIKGWAARDSDNAVFIHSKEPKRNYHCDGVKCWVVGGERFRLSIFDRMFPELTWEDEPIEVELTIKKI